jgi:shikimate kinase
MTSKRELRNITLIGFMGSGKTSVGHWLAQRTHRGFIDTDHLIEMRAGKSIAKIFAENGEAVFRDLECQAVQELLTFNKMVIATGGGLGANPDHLASLKTHSLVVCLWSSVDSIWQRVQHQTHRPLLQCPDPRARIQELLALRGPIYKQADVLISTELRSVREVAQQVLHQWQLAQTVESTL